MFLALALVLIALTIVLANTRPDLGFQFWISLALAVITLVLSVPGAVQAIRGLRPEGPERDVLALARAVRRRWDDAAAQRGLQDDALDITWRDTARPVTSSSGRVLGTAVDAPQEVTRLATYWKTLGAPRQLVIIGPPGAGKTSTLILLANALLDEDDAENAPIPVAINLSGWDPRKTGIVAWSVRQLIDEFPDLRRKVDSGASTAEWLLESGRLTPFFDGLDEALHLADAIDAINAPMRRRSFVISCRAQEFADAVEQQHESLSTAPVIELQPVTPEQAIRYLPTGNQLGGEERWSNVITKLVADPAGALGTALSTPLMVYLAQVAYKAERHADELLRFDSASAIEQRLLQAYLPAFYPPARTALTGRSARSRYTPHQAERWLGFLASRLDGIDPQGVAWWRLPAMCGPWFLAGYIALAIAIAWLLVGTAAGIWYGMIFAACIGLRIPSYSNPVISTKGLRPGGVITALVCGMICGTIAYVSGNLVSGLAVGIASAVAVNFAVEAYKRHGVDENPRTPVEVLKEDVKHSIELALSAAVSVFAAAVYLDGPFAALIFGLVGAFAGGQAGYFDTGPFKGAVPGAATYGTIGAIAGMQRLDIVDGILLGLGTMSTIVALNVWYRSLLARLWLHVSGKLPFTAMRFLENAANLGVLRRTGAVYRFRHLRIQNYLAASFTDSRKLEAVVADAPRKQEA